MQGPGVDSLGRLVVVAHCWLAEPRLAQRGASLTLTPNQSNRTARVGDKPPAGDYEGLSWYIGRWAVRPCAHAARGLAVQSPPKAPGAACARRGAPPRV